jgi:rubredoxin
MPLDKVRLYAAFGWECPSCHARNFEESIPLELNEDEMAQVRRHLGSYTPGSAFSKPDRVRCPVCGARFESDK